ncbi:major facilitator superfamily domain-containing protein [Aspergillus navahoensis]
MEDPEKAPGSNSNSSPSFLLPKWRKFIILFVVSWMTLAVTFSSTSLLPATPEIALEFNTTSETLNITNAGVLLAMGLSSLLWGPLAILIGRQLSYNIAAAVLILCSGLTAGSRSMGMFTACRTLGGFTGTTFMVSGQTVLADIFEPEVRRTALGFFMLGTVAGPAIGPCIGGVIVTFTSWRYIYWLQTAMAGFGLVLSLIFVPEVQQEVSSSNTAKKMARGKITLRYALKVFNPARVFRLWLYPNLFFSFLTCGLLTTYLYALLSSARTIFNPRFNLTSALVSGLFYLAPGSGFLVGSVLGGRLSDITVRKYIARRGLEALPSHRAEAVAGKYIIQYLFSAGASALVVPLIDRIGVGWTFTISAFLTLTGAVLVLIITRWGFDMQRWVERRVPIPAKS